MKILIIQGPNLNLIGLKSAKTGDRITLDKVNRGLRLQVRNKDIELKFLQTHRIEKVITLLHRNRNWADGILIAPMSWARYEFTLKETLELIDLPFVEVHFNGEYFFGTSVDDSILSSSRVDAVSGKPDFAFIEGLSRLIYHLSK